MNVSGDLQFLTKAGITELIENKNAQPGIFVPLHIMLVFTLWLTFDLQIPRIINLKPSRGPVSGGTIVNISGSHLDAGSNVSVMFKDQPCTYLRSAVKNTTDDKTSNTNQHTKFSVNQTAAIRENILLRYYCWKKILEMEWWSGVWFFNYIIYSI